jgi:hypothetical protein
VVGQEEVFSAEVAQPVDRIVVAQKCADHALFGVEVVR